jgi:hypothetical protein
LPDEFFNVSIASRKVDLTSICEPDMKQHMCLLMKRFLLLGTAKSEKVM